MNTNIKATNINTSEAINDYVSKRLSKIEKLLRKDPTVQCDIELAKTTSHHQKGDIFRAEVHVVGANMNIYVSSEKEDLYSAIDDVADQVKLELKSKKSKDISLIRRSGARVKNMMKGLWPWGKSTDI